LLNHLLGGATKAGGAPGNLLKRSSDWARRGRKPVHRFNWRTWLSLRRTPAPRCAVAIDERGVRCHRPDGTVEGVAWDDLRAVEILTTDAGPWSEDLFWVLHGRDGGCVVPQGASGADALLARLQELPGFNNLAVIQAMGSAEEARFPCWNAADTSPGATGAPIPS
jgi:hypothetical protein